LVDWPDDGYRDFVCGLGFGVCVFAVCGLRVWDPDEAQLVGIFNKARVKDPDTAGRQED